MIVSEMKYQSKVGQRFNKVDREVTKAMIETSDKWAIILVREIQKRAGGRPGPRVITGVYRASWRVEKKTSGFLTRNVWISVVTSHPAAHRLEYGYIGIDSLGRRYHQPPFPHVRPAREAIAKPYQKDLERAIEKAIKKAA